MSFAERVIKMRKKTTAAWDMKRSIEDDLDDPHAIAASKVNISAKRVLAYPIGAPRASSMYDSCNRFHVIGTIEKYEKPEWSGVKERILFGIGNAYHYWVQNNVDLFEDRRIGWWKCLACGKVHSFGKPPTKHCKCGAHPRATEYLEHHMELKGKYPCGGHPDMFLYIDPHCTRVVELKSIKGDDFQKLKAPIIQHVYQIHTYMFGCAQDKTLPVETDPNLSYIMYLSKRHIVKTLPLKMFTVERDESIIRFIKKKTSDYKKGIENYPKFLPEPIDECMRNEFRNYRAKQCVCRTKCLELLDG